jgi:hypothetical protein
VRLLAKDLAAEEKAAMRLRQKRERQRMAQAIVTPTAGLTHLQRQRSAREARSRALAPRVSSPSSLSSALAVLGPTPGSVVTGAKSGSSREGRTRQGTAAL